MNQLHYVKSMLVAAALGCGASAFAGEWTVVPETSTVSFIGAQQGTKFNGRFGTFAAHINLDAADPTKGSIVGTVQVDSVNTRDHDRDARCSTRTGSTPRNSRRPSSSRRRSRKAPTVRIKPSANSR